MRRRAGLPGWFLYLHPAGRGADWHVLVFGLQERQQHHHRLQRRLPGLQQRGGVFILAIFRRWHAQQQHQQHNQQQQRVPKFFGAVAVALTPADLGEIEAAISQITVIGDRYPEALRKQAGR